MTTLPHEHAATTLLEHVTCPNCWHRFPPEQILFIARHESHIGDEIVGPAGYQRFLPTRFDLAGDAIDARGLTCQQLACPRCHLEISRPLIEMPPLFVSVVGGPGSGKSYMLASITWMLRQQAGAFGFGFSDGDPTANRELQTYEELLFLSGDPESPVSLRKTELAGEQLYQSIVLDGQRLTFPRPFQFTLVSSNQHMKRRHTYNRALVLYDNAGEHFQPGEDTTGSPVTRHLSESAATLFLFDPTQDPRFRDACRFDDPQLKHGVRPDGIGPVMRQEAILSELAARVRRYRGLGQTAKVEKPLIMVLAKADIWLDVDDELQLGSEPFIGEGSLRLDHERIDRMSSRVRELMVSKCPEIVAVAEGFSQHVTFIPISSLGVSPEYIPDGRYYAVRPSRIKPRWVTVPLLYVLSRVGVIGKAG